MLLALTHRLLGACLHRIGLIQEGLIIARLLKREICQLLLEALEFSLEGFRQVVNAVQVIPIQSLLDVVLT